MLETALLRLVSEIEADFSLRNVRAEHDFRWSAPDFQFKGTSRVATVPGSRGGSAGRVGEPKQPGRLPARPLATWFETFTVYLTARSGNGRRQQDNYQAVCDLFEEWYRSAWKAARGTFRVTSLEWLQENAEFQFGATLLVTGTIETAIFDVAPTTVEPSATSSDLTLNDESGGTVVTP